MSNETSAKHNGAANLAAPHRRPWTFSERRWEPDFRAPDIKLKPLDARWRAGRPRPAA